MLDELSAMAQFVRFRLVLLRTPPAVYAPELQELRKQGVEILIKPFNSAHGFRKSMFALKFFIKNLHRFWGSKNFVFGIKAIYWFIRLDSKAFSKNAKIHAQFATQASIIAMLYKKYFKNLEYSFAFHAHDIYYPNRWFDLLVNESTTAFSISNYNLKSVEKTFPIANKEKLLLSRLGVFLPNTKVITRHKTFAIGFLSWWGEKKGLLLLLQAVTILFQKGKLPIKVILAGDGPMREKALSFIQENDLASYIEDRGKIFGKDKKIFYSDIDVFVLPSIQTKNDMDGIPVVLMEAISYGVPIISTDISGIPEICSDNHNGLLVPPEDPIALSDAIKKFYNMDNERYQTFRGNAYESSKEYDIIQNSHWKLQKSGWLPTAERL